MAYKSKIDQAAAGKRHYEANKKKINVQLTETKNKGLVIEHMLMRQEKKRVV